MLCHCLYLSWHCCPILHDSSIALYIEYWFIFAIVTLVPYFELLCHSMFILHDSYHALYTECYLTCATCTLVPLHSYTSCATACTCCITLTMPCTLTATLHVLVLPFLCPCCMRCATVAQFVHLLVHATWLLPCHVPWMIRYMCYCYTCAIFRTVVPLHAHATWRYHDI